MRSHLHGPLAYAAGCQIPIPNRRRTCEVEGRYPAGHVEHRLANVRPKQSGSPEASFAMTTEMVLDYATIKMNGLNGGNDPSAGWPWSKLHQLPRHSFLLRALVCHSIR